jgi:hypothetical protein
MPREVTYATGSNICVGNWYIRQEVGILLDLVKSYIQSFLPLRQTFGAVIYIF